MKYPCELIRDIMPLYCDEVCSEKSAEAVKAHIADCPECRAFLETMSKPQLEKEAAEYERRQLDSMKAVKKNLEKKRKIMLAVGLSAGIVLMTAVMAVGLLFGIINFGMAKNYGFTGVRMWSDDIADYESLIGENAWELYKEKFPLDETIFPEKITDGMTAENFKFVYNEINGREFAASLTVEYTEEAFAEELDRLASKGNDGYKGIFGVSGEPDNYDTVALDSDEKYGLVYAVVPENGSPTVTYVMIETDKFYMETDIYQYIRGSYLPEGLNVHKGSPYMNEMQKK